MGMTVPMGLTVREAQMTGYPIDKSACLVRLRRAEGQVRGLQRLIEADSDCIEVLTQISSVTKALQSVGLGLLDQHIRSCVLDDARSGSGGDDGQVSAAVVAVERLLRS
jgi:DNA-binding FrmR family transcriptional regulator